jgi:hypothetical protein
MFYSMKTHNNHLGDNEDMDNINQDIAFQIYQSETIKGHGRVGYGMNGKDADLDCNGQCSVQSIVIIDPVNSDTMFIEIELYRYVSICTPTHEDEETERKLQDMAESIIIDTTEYRGEWTGSDYWMFSMEEVIRVPLLVEEYENPNYQELAARCAYTIYNSSEGQKFETFACNLNQTIDKLSECLK